MVAPVGPEDSGLSGAAVGVGGLVIGLAVIFVALRFYTRIFTRLGLWWDDWLILFSVVLILLTAALVLVGNEIDPFGDWVSTNVDPDYIYTDSDVLYMKLSYISCILYFAISSTTKLGILLMYIRIFFVSTGFRTQVIIVSALVLAYWISATIATLLVCRPMSLLWTSGNYYPTYCYNYNIVWLVMGIFELFLDVVTLVLPVRAVMDVRLNTRKKLSVIGIFLLGGFVIVTGIVKVILAYNPGGHSPQYGNAEVWVTLHAGMAVVCACLPIMKPLVNRVSGSTLFKRNSSSSIPSTYGTSESDYLKSPRVGVESCEITV